MAELHEMGLVEDKTNQSAENGAAPARAAPTIPAITNAVYNAVGVRAHSIPLDQEMILKEIKSAPGQSLRM